MTDGDLSGRTLGDITLRELIAEGGHGAVYRGEQRLLGRDVVVKVLHGRRRRNPVAHERFLREAQLASRLDHPYAAHIYGFGVEEADGLLWIAMELVHGVTLHHWLAAHGPMPLERFVPFFESVAQVVHAAHQQGIVHRDLKPSNVMVIEHNGSLLPKLLDFGIAKAPPEATPLQASLPADAGPEAAPDTTRARTARIRSKRPGDHGTPTHTSPLGPPGDPQLTRPGSGIGSAAYMSPEQWRDAWSVGPATDIYALGVLAYKVLTGGEPFVGERTDDYYRMHASALPPPLGSEFAPAINAVIQRALAKSPQDRHGSALEMAAALRDALRSSEREQLRAAAQQWEDRRRAPSFLWGREVLPDLERWAHRMPSGALSPLECSFVAASHRRARRAVWLRRASVVLVTLAAIGGLQYRAATHARVAEARAAQAELEQGRAALLHGEPDAQLHLADAYRREPSPSTAFMLARALQPRLAEQARFASSSGRMWSAAFSPDGRTIVTTDDRDAQVWDARTYRRLFALRHGETVYQAVFNGDGTRIVTACGDGAVRVWDATDGGLVRELRIAAKPRLYTVALSPNGALVAAADIDGGMAHVWDMSTGAAKAEVRCDPAEFPGLAFSSDGYWLAATGGNDVELVDTRTWKPAVTIRAPRIRGLAFDPTSARLLTGSAAGDVAIWEVPSGARIHHLRDAGDPVDAVAFSPDGRLVVAAMRDGTQQVWHAEAGEAQSRFNQRHGKILAVEFDRTSKLILAAGADGTAVVSEAEYGAPIAILDGPQSVIRVAHFDPSANRVVGASWDGTARVWNATAPYRRWATPPIMEDCGVVTNHEPDRRVVAVQCRDQTTRVWDTSRGLLLAELPAVSRVEGDFASAFPAVSEAGDRAAIAQRDRVEVYEVPGGRLRRTLAHSAAVSAVAFAGAGRDVASGAVDGSLFVARDDGALLALPAASGGIDAVAILPDGRVAAADERRRLRVYDRGGAILADLEIPVRVMSLRVDGDRIVAVPIHTGHAAPPLLLDIDHYRIVAQLAGHVGAVFSARWVVGHQIITVGGDGAARLWDGETGRLHQVYRGGSRYLADGTLTPDGLVIAGGGDGRLRFWDRDSGRLLWALEAHSSAVIGVHVERNGDVVTRGFAGEVSRWTLPNPEQVIGACADRERCAIVER